jgi:N-acetylmuramoyl-L-alanine amidase
MRGAARALLGVVALASLGAAHRPPGLGDVSGIAIADHGSRTRVVVELSRQATYAVHHVDSPPRLYVDIDGTWIERAHAQPRAVASPGPVARVRGGQNTLRRARVVLELDGAGRRYRAFHLAEPFRIVLDVFDADAPPPLLDTTSGPQHGGAEPRPADPGPAVHGVGSSFDTRPVQRIAIDAGHGGKDPGAIGAGRVREKDVVLRIAQALRGELQREGFDVVLTRDRDRYLTLQERTDRANRADADLFLSIHANSSPRRATSGVETYLLDTRYDRATARVAARENGTSVAQLSQLQMILASLRLGYRERFAANVAHSIHRSLVTELRVGYGRVHDLGVKRGPFMVLFHADMPAVLVEVGFVSNRADARRLDSREFARHAARGIARGVVRYRDEHARSLVAGR